MTPRTIHRPPGRWAALAALALAGCMADDRPAELLAAPAPAPATGFDSAWAAPSLYGPDVYSGNWTVREGANMGTCRILLRPMLGRATGDAATFGCFGALFNTSSWGVNGNMITLYNIAREPVAMLWITAPNRIEGGGYLFTR